MAEGYLTTHVLDTARGLPAPGMRIQLFRINGAEMVPLADVMTNDDGRTDARLLEQDTFETGHYLLLFHSGDYLRATGQADEGEILFLEQVPIRFGMGDEDAHYHVPLLLSPYSYSTYRGS